MIFGLDAGLLLVDFITTAALYLIISLSLNLEYGFSGVPDFGKVLFVTAGAAICGGVAGRLAVYLLGMTIPGGFLANNTVVAPQITTILQGNIPVSLAIFFCAVIIAAVVGGALGFVMSFPAIRLREDYLAMLLFVLSVFVQVFLINYSPLAGGQNGISIPDPYAWTGNSYYASMVVMAITAVLAYLLISRISTSPTGRVLRALRDNPVAAEALGKDVVGIRRNVLILASAIAAIAGALYSFYTLSFNPYSFNPLQWTFYPFLIIILGGLANIRGTLVGTIVFWVMLKAISIGAPSFQNYIPFDTVWLNYLLPGFLIIAIIFLRPEGILKERPTKTV